MSDCQPQIRTSGPSLDIVDPCSSIWLLLNLLVERMGIIGVGIDIVHIPRIVSLVARRTPAKLAARILSPSEFNEWETSSPSATTTPIVTAGSSGMIAAEDLRWVRFLAVRWAVKEAAYKALFPNYKPTWKELSVSKEPGDGGKPRLRFEKFENVRLHVSVSHDGEYTVANVLAED